MFDRVRKIQREKKKNNSTDDTYRNIEFKVKLNSVLKEIDILLECGAKRAIISIEDDELPYFSELIYASDMAEYRVEQLSANEYALSKKEVDF